MAVVKPFSALRYSPDKAGDLNKVMAPPYDVISSEFQEELYRRSPYNVIRLILGKTNPDDSPGHDRYSRASECLDKWRKEGVLARDPAPAIYYYTQGYTSKDGVAKTRRGFIALLKLEEFGKGSIHPHERTLSGPKADRLNLLKATEANLCCIFSLYPESKGVPPEKRITAMLEAAASSNPIIAVKGDDEVTNKLWMIDDAEVIEKTASAMRDKTLFIADGHHRYETALNYRDLRLKSTPKPTSEAGWQAGEAGWLAGTEPFNYVMMYFASMDDEGLEIFPTHRVVHGLNGFTAKAFLERLGSYFDMEEFAFAAMDEAAVRLRFMKKLGEGTKGSTRLGLFVRDRDAYYVLTLKGGKTMDRIFDPAMADVYKTLDVSVLHSLILGDVLGVSREAQERQENLLYVKDANEALDAGRKDKNQLVFLMNPTKVEDVKRVSEAGLLMPQKSTYFYPKLLSGLVINSFRD
ncbi:MAG: DUF1015 domain-containing protein [Deltaproteobacteria bacterium]|nr:DUF1015 domain-containing protein [Deltaproteobacteria bacterium]